MSLLTLEIFLELKQRAINNDVFGKLPDSLQLQLEQLGFNYNTWFTIEDKPHCFYYVLDCYCEYSEDVDGTEYIDWCLLIAHSSDIETETSVRLDNILSNSCQVCNLEHVIDNLDNLDNLTKDKGYSWGLKLTYFYDKYSGDIVCDTVNVTKY
jgi:hypothetical protein